MDTHFSQTITLPSGLIRGTWFSTESLVKKVVFPLGRSKATISAVVPVAESCHAIVWSPICADCLSPLPGDATSTGGVLGLAVSNVNMEEPPPPDSSKRDDRASRVRKK